MDCNFPNVAMPIMWPEVHLNADRQQFQQQWHADSSSHQVWVKEENHRNLVPSENSHMSYDSPANSGKVIQIIRKLFTPPLVIFSNITLGNVLDFSRILWFHNIM